MKLNELATAVHGIGEQLAKAKDEIVARIDALQLELADVALPAEAVAALEAVKAAAQSLDDIVPDA